MGYLKKYIAKYYRLFLAAICFLSLEASCDLFQPTIMAKIVDIGIKNRNLLFVLQMGGVMLLVTAVGAAAAVTRNNISSRVSQRFGTELRSDLFHKVQNLSFESVGKFETASLVTRLTNDVTQTQNFVNGMMRIFVKAPLLCIGSIIMAVILDPKLSIIIAVIFPVIILIIYVNTRVGFPFFRKVQGAIDSLNGVMREYLSGVRVVKAFNRSDFEEKRFSNSSENLASIQTSAMKVMSVFTPATMLVINIGIICVLWFGGIGIDNGSFQVGKIIAFINYMTQMANSLMMISTVFTMFVRARASAERIGEVMNTGDTIMKSENPVEPCGTGTIEFKNVSFSYSGNLEEPVLKDINFSCSPGETIGVIGTTGSGKTSLVSLIPRFYDATAGTVNVYGVDVRRMDEHALRENIAVVPQKNTLFTGTILENIRWGNETATLSQVEQAAKTAQAHDFIMSLPDKYDTILGQGGVNLSGGQKQRLSIARALVKDPAILILDDCTSAVDIITEGRIRNGLKNYSKDLLSIIIAQRISSVMAADKIIVLDNGRIIGSGTNEELLQNCGVYREIYESQYGKEGM